MSDGPPERQAPAGHIRGQDQGDRRMLGYIILIILQIGGAWALAPQLKRFLPAIPQFGGYNVEIFVWAVLYAVIVFVIGFIGSIVLKGVRTPGAGTLSLALLLALIFAALTFVTPLTQAVGQIVPRLEILLWPLIGAVIGYMIKR
jgi:hypothetical protein